MWCKQTSVQSIVNHHRFESTWEQQTVLIKGLCHYTWRLNSLNIHVSTQSFCYLFNQRLLSSQSVKAPAETLGVNRQMSQWHEMKYTAKKGQTQAWFKLPKASQARHTCPIINSTLRGGIESPLGVWLRRVVSFRFPAAPTTASWTTPSNTTGRSFLSFPASTTRWMSSVALTSAWATRSALQWVPPPPPPQRYPEQAGQHPGTLFLAVSVSDSGSVSTCWL